MNVNWILLVVAGLLEVGFASMLKLTENFTRLWPTVAFVLFAISSFLCLNRAITSGPNPIPVGTAYGVWTGIGAGGAMIVGMLCYGEPATAWRIFFLVMLLSAVVGLKMVSSH